MLEPLERISRGRKINVRSSTIPIRGWSTRDKYLADKRYCPVLKNWMLFEGQLTVRPGYSQFATGFPGSVESLMRYTAGGTDKLFAASGTAIYDASSSGAIGAAVVSSLTNARFQHVMFANTTDNFLIAVNGDDGLRTYDGSSWASQSISGVAAGDLIGVTSHHFRLWFVEEGSLDAWYLAPYAISGTATKFPLGPLCKRGGSIMAIASWSYDGGSGPDDYLVFITTQGELIIYAGIDPASTQTWVLVGVYPTSIPLSRRCFVKYGADLALLTESGVVLVSEVLNNIGEEDARSSPIRSEFINAVSSARSVFGWEVTLYPKRGFLIANIPNNTSGFSQFVYNPLMKSWFPFEGIPSVCWAVYGNQIYFGGNTIVYSWDIGDINDDGEPVEADIRFIWNSYGAPFYKNFTLIRPNILTDGTVYPSISMKLDYDESLPSQSLESSESPQGSAWDADDWDDGTWGGNVTVYNPWLTAEGYGIWAAPRLVVSTLTATVNLIGVDVVFEVGGLV